MGILSVLCRHGHDGGEGWGSGKGDREGDGNGRVSQRKLPRSGF